MKGFCGKKDHTEVINFHVISVTTCTEFNSGHDHEAYTEKVKHSWENQAALQFEALCFQYYLAERQNNKDRHGDGLHESISIDAQVTLQKLRLDKNFLYQNKSKSGVFFHSNLSKYVIGRH